MPGARSSPCRTCSRSPSTSPRPSPSAWCAGDPPTAPIASAAAPSAWWWAAPISTRPAAAAATSWEGGCTDPRTHPPREKPMPRYPIARAALCLAAVAVLAAGCGKPAERSGGARSTPGGGLKVGLVFDVGGRGDKSFNDAAYAGLERAQKSLGVEVQTLETGEGTDREAALRQLAAGGSQLVFGVGFLVSDDILQLAREVPNVKFACVAYSVKPGATLPPNLAALTFKEEEGSYLVGALAALLNHTGKVG